MTVATWLRTPDGRPRSVRLTRGPAPLTTTRGTIAVVGHALTRALTPPPEAHA